MDVFAVLELAGAIPPEQLPQALADVSRLYKLTQGGKPDVVAMDKANTLEPTVAAAARLTAQLDKLLRDPAQRPRVVAVAASLFGQGAA